MPATQYVWGARIYLRDSLTQDIDIGLYTASPGALSELRWVEHVLEGTDSWGLTWKSGLLVRDAFSPITEGADLRRCGATSLSESFSVTVCNIDKLCHDITSGGINLVGCRIDICEFELDTATLNQVSRVVGTGVCEEPRWTETDFTIPIRESSYKRNATLGTLIDEANSPSAETETMGECIPLTFGELRPNELTGSPDTYAKLIRTAKAESDWKDNAVNYGLFSAIEVGASPDRIRVIMSGLTAINYASYPVVPGAGTPPNQYAVKIASGVLWQKWEGSTWNGITSGIYNCDLLIGKYLHVLDGTSNGKYRKISLAYVNCNPGADSSYIWCEVHDYFEDTLSGNASATAEDQSWVEIIGIDREYEADVWPCKSFVDSEGTEVSSKLSLFSYCQNQAATGVGVAAGAAQTMRVTEPSPEFYALPQYAYTEIAGGDKNSIEIDAKLFRDDPDEMYAYHFIPVGRVDRFTEENLDPFNSEAGDSFDEHIFRSGIYARSSDSDYFNVTSVVDSGNKTAVSDSQKSTCFTTTVEITKSGTHDGDYSVIVAMQFDPPSIPDNLLFDKCYVGMHARWENQKPWPLRNYQPEFLLRWRKWIGYAIPVISNSDGQKVRPTAVETFGSVSIPTIANLPDFYYDIGNGSLYFYWNNDLTVSNNTQLFGLSRFEIGDIDNVKKYRAIDRFLIVARDRPTTDTDLSERLSVSELCMIFEKRISIKECIYSPMRGRIYGDTWGSRRTSANLMSNPIDILEHVLRLQNWSETGEATPAAGWGHAYGSTAKIDTSTSYGGFDHAALAGLKSATCARQVLEIEESTTRELVDSLCRDFFLCQYKRTYTTTPAEAGQEQVAYLLNDTAATESITLDDVVGEIGQIQEPRVEDIYCEPFVRFCWNPARDKFDRIISVKNSSATAWTSDNTPGFSAAEGEAFWNSCHDLWDTYGVVTPAPKHMTDKYWIYSYSEAKQYLERWISWMQLRRIALSVGYVKGRAWHVAMKVSLTLPHHTNGNTLECLIERVSKSKNDNRVELNLIMLDYVTTESMYLKESYQTKVERGGAGYSDQTENYQTKAERGGTGTNDWQETY